MPDPSRRYPEQMKWGCTSALLTILIRYHIRIGFVPVGRFATKRGTTASSQPTNAAVHQRRLDAVRVVRLMMYARVQLAVGCRGQLGGFGGL